MSNKIIYCATTNKKPPLNIEMAFCGGGEQGSRTPSAEKRTFYLSGKDASAGALLSSSSRRQNDYNIILKSEQNKNAITGSDDIFIGPFNADGVSLPDKYLYNSTSKDSVKGAIKRARRFNQTFWLVVMKRRASERGV